MHAMYVAVSCWHAEVDHVPYVPAEIGGHAKYVSADLSEHDLARTCIHYQLQ